VISRLRWGNSWRHCSNTSSGGAQSSPMTNSLGLGFFRFRKLNMVLFASALLSPQVAESAEGRQKPFRFSAQSPRPPRLCGEQGLAYCCSRLARRPSISTRETSGRVNSGGSGSPRSSIWRTCVPERITCSDGSCGHVLELTMPPHLRQ